MDRTIEINDRIRQYIMVHFPLARKQSIVTDDSPLLDSGIIDSMGILELLMFIEEEFGIAVSDEDLLPENFETIAHLVAFIQTKNNGNLTLKSEE